MTTPDFTGRGRAPLFKSARTIARHRRAAYVACGIVVAGLVIGVFVARNHDFATQGAPRPNPALIEAAAARPPARNGSMTVVVQDSIHNGIYALRSNGGLRKVVDCPETKCPVLQSFAWAPSGQLVAFDVAWEPPDSTDYVGIHILNLSTGADQRISRVGQRIDDLAWSPDGSRLAYAIANETGNREIRVIAADGSSPSTVVEPVVGTASSPTWSPDGKRLAYAVRRSIHRRSKEFPFPGRQSSVYIGTLGDVRPDGLLLEGAPTRRGRRLRAGMVPGGTVLAVRSCHGIKLLTPAGRNVTPRPGIRPVLRSALTGGRLGPPMVVVSLCRRPTASTPLTRTGRTFDDSRRLGRLGRWGGGLAPAGDRSNE